ncbi:MAG: hypothetical protein LLG40_13305 [Deltaproteobacteria bacterium]|nr:hypothetical protein [Deltaproteobacteria bacterium]
MRLFKCLKKKNATVEKLDKIICMLEDIQRKEEQIMSELSLLQEQVAASITVEKSAIELINGIAAKITAAGTDAVALAALTEELKASAATLATAVTANT